jgi:hypothetical protein
MLLLPKNYGRRNVKLFNENGEEVSFEEIIDWWLEHYEGLEHLTEGGTSSPETWFTINTIMKRCLEKLRDRQKRLRHWTGMERK